MKAVITIAIIVLVGFGAYKLWDYWDQTEQQKAASERAAAGEVRPETLEGLPAPLEPRLREAQERGTESFKEFIDTIKKTPSVRDPRLAWIELDYVVMISGKDPVEAKKLFAKIRERTPPNSPVYPRVKSLENTFK